MIRIATDSGIVDLDNGSRTVRLEQEGVRALSGRWAVLDRDAVTTPDGSPNVTFPEVRPWCVADRPDGDGALVGTAEARLFEIAPDGSAEPLASFDAIPSRDGWYTPWGGPPDTRSLAFTAAGDALVNVHVGGIWFNAAGSYGWEPVVEVDADVHQVVAGPGSEAVAAAAVGCGVSLDGGRTWTWSADGLHGPYCRAAAVAGDVVLVSASTGPFSESGALYRRPLKSDGPFERCTAGLPESFPFNLDTFWVDADGADAVLGTKDGRLFVSSDAGASWELRADDLGEIRAVELG